MGNNKNKKNKYRQSLGHSSKKKILRSGKIRLVGFKRFFLICSKSANFDNFRSGNLKIKVLTARVQEQELNINIYC